MSEANKKYVTIGVVGMIPEIRVNGPLKTPHYIDLEMVKAMVLHGRRVYEHNPAKPSERVLLTIENMDKDNFGKDAEKDWFSKEVCGGPHVQHTAQIGKFKIEKEQSSSAGVRRIRATISGGLPLDK